MSKEPVFTKTVKFDDGAEETFSRRERPFIYVNEKGEAIALFTACLPKDGPSRIVVQPIDHYLPSN
jgi:ribosome biogenesis protein Nip4